MNTQDIALFTIVINYITINFTIRQVSKCIKNKPTQNIISRKLTSHISRCLAVNPGIRLQRKSAPKLKTRLGLLKKYK